MRSALVHHGGRLVAVGLGLLATATSARAAPPSAQDFQIDSWVTDPEGQNIRLFSHEDARSLVNRASCECGHRISAQVWLLPGVQYDPGMVIETLVGTHCDIGEAQPEGQFRPCARLASNVAQVYRDSITTSFHPGWLAFGLSTGSPTRDPNDPQAIASGTCGPVQGGGGVYLCAHSNATGGCQADEFFLHPVTEVGAVSPLELVYDFMPPLSAPTDLAIERSGTDAVLSWRSATASDIHGFRVLCEEADTGKPAAGFAMNPSGPTTLAAGDFYFNAHNLCGGEPFSTVPMADGEHDGTGGCGDGHLDDGEACDDGHWNSDDGLCSEACTLNVSAGLYALDWSYICSDHLPFGTDSTTISNLEGGKAYNLVLVTYDRSGNPRVFPKVLKFGLEGDGGDGPEPPDIGCGCRTSSGGGATGLVLVALGLAGARRRRRP